VQPIRVLIVDDSAVIRRLLRELLEADPAITIAGTAGNGALGLARIAEIKPDLVTLDVEMPGMSGIETLIEIRKLYPKLPVIMFSTLTGPGASKTVEALAFGASDYAAKPSVNGMEEARDTIRRDLIPKIKALCHVPKLPAAKEPPPSIPFGDRVPRKPDRVDVVAIGSSTGGPNALAALMPQLPRDFPVPILIAQHMPPMFTHLLAKRLGTLTSLRVEEGKDGEKIEPGKVWVAPGDYHMTVSRKDASLVLGLNRDAPENSCRPAVDVLFRSVARSYGANVLAVVLTGMGSDGTRGAATIREAGGSVIAQDESSSVVWGMPGSVVSAGLAEQTYPLAQIGSEIARRVTLRRAVATRV
jgi:two-component system, chemotaxis family, protein-glutamate methylesterase/glutaminase